MNWLLEKKSDTFLESHNKLLLGFGVECVVHRIDNGTKIFLWKHGKFLLVQEQIQPIKAPFC